MTVVRDARLVKDLPHDTAEQVEQLVGRPVDIAAVEVMAEPVRDRALAEAVPL